MVSELELLVLTNYFLRQAQKYAKKNILQITVSGQGEKEQEEKGEA